MNDSLSQTVKWFLARSDVEAADKLLEWNSSTKIGLLANAERREQLQAYMRRCWPSYFGDQSDYSKIYENAGAHEATFDGDRMVMAMGQMWRVQQVSHLMQQRLPGAAHVLDFGCSRGGQAINLHNSMPDKRFTLVDIDSKSIDEARRLTTRLARHPHMFNFRVGDERERMESFVNTFDAAMLLEVMEHVKDWRVVVTKAELMVKPGGWLFVSVPSGPVEYSQWLIEPERMTKEWDRRSLHNEHVREFQHDDLLDIFGAKPGFVLQYTNVGRSAHLPMEIGQWVFCYQVDHKTPVGEIDWDRKLSVKRKFEGELPGWE